MDRYRKVNSRMEAGAHQRARRRTVLLGAALAMTIATPAAFAADSGLLQDGTLTVAATASFPPIVSVDQAGKYVGIDADIIEAIAKQLQLKVNWINIKFESIIPGITAKRFDVGMTGITDTKQREQVVDFVNYANVGSGIIAQKGNPKNVKGLDSLCGLTVAAETGDVA